MTEKEILNEIICRAEQILSFAKSIQVSRARAEKDELLSLWYLRVNKQIKHMKSIVLPALSDAIDGL